MESNPNNLPLDVAVVIEEHTANPEQAAQSATDLSNVGADNLVQRLLAIRERLFWLHACWATTLSPDVAYEADRYRQLFHDLGEELRKQDADALDRIISGHEALLLAEPTPPKPTLPLAAQRWFELAAEMQNTPKPDPPEKPQGYVPDGLQSLV